MSRNRLISIAIGGLVTIVTFVAGLWIIVFGAMFPQSDLIFVISLAISPLAVVAVVAGFLVWWICLFFLTLIFGDSDSNPDSKLDGQGS